MAVLPLQTNMSKTLFAQVGFLRILDMLFTIIWAFKRYQVYLGTIFFRVEPYVSWTEEGVLIFVILWICNMRLPIRRSAKVSHPNSSLSFEQFEPCHKPVTARAACY